jgi:hypothetical protein
VTVAVVTTTIHADSRLDRWAAQLGPNDYLVIAEDHKTPREELRRLTGMWSQDTGVNVVHTYDESLPFSCVKWLDWNSIQRRNVATLIAMSFKPDVLFTVDDDNFPATNTHVAEVVKYMSGEIILPTVQATSRWYNVGKMLEPNVTHRGFPLSQRGRTSTTWVDQLIRVGVHASLWLGDPDIDAVERIVNDPQTSIHRDWNPRDATFALAPGTWCPFNSQATAYHGALAPLLCVPPGLGRYDDIWGSYIARRIMDHLNYSVAYGSPLVYQERNPHNLVRDLKDEMYGMEYTDWFTDKLRGIELTGTDPLNCLRQVQQALDMETFIPMQAREFLLAWVNDVEEMLT